MIRRVFVSDVHMSPGGHPSYEWLTDQQATAFGGFLDYIAADLSFEELVLVGDMMDDWVYPIDTQPPTYAQIAGGKPPRPQIIDKLRAIAQSRPVTYLVGNHDITITKNSIPNFGNGTCPHIIFQGSYDIDGLWAEHGHQYDIWNSFDPKNDIPVGHYISRLYASLTDKEGHPGRWQAIIADLLTTVVPMIENPYVTIALDYLVDRLGITEGTGITTLNGGTITVAEVRKQYGDLSERWKKGNHDFSGLFEQFLMEQSPLGLDKIAPLTAMRGNKKVVIFGHTHMAKMEYVYTWDDGPNGPENIYQAIYANCGSWCEENAQYTYVVDEYDEGAKKHTVSLRAWDNPGFKEPEPLTI